MSGICSVILGNKDDTAVMESMMFSSPIESDCPEVIAGGKVFMHRESTWNDINHLLIVQGGLPGDWLRKAEQKARLLAKDNPDKAAWVLIPQGVLPDSGILRISAEAVVQCREVAPEYFDKTFDLSRYRDGLFAAMQGISPHLAPRTGVHILGQSYGAASALWALGKCMETNTAIPDSVALLAPFVKIGLDPEDQIHRLSIVNPELCNYVHSKTVLDRSSDEDDGEPLFEYQKKMLKNLFKTCHERFNIPDDHNILADHANSFGRRYLDVLKSINALWDFDKYRDFAMAAFRGAADPHIGVSHCNLIRRITHDRAIVLDRLDQDGHDMDRLEFAVLLRFFGVHGMINGARL